MGCRRISEVRDDGLLLVDDLTMRGVACTETPGACMGVRTGRNYGVYTQPQARDMNSSKYILLYSMILRSSVSLDFWNFNTFLLFVSGWQYSEQE